MMIPFLFMSELYAITPQYSIYLYTKIWGVLKYSSNNTKQTNWDELFVSHVGVLMLHPDKLDSIVSEFSKPFEMDKVAMKTIAPSKPLFNWISQLDKDNISEKTIDYLKYIAVTQNEKGAAHWYRKELPGLYEKNNALFDKNKFKTNMQESLLGIAKAWNVIEYFYFYKAQTRRNWDSALFEAIHYTTDTNNKSTPDYIRYRLSIQKLAAQLNDCHATSNADNILNFHYWGAGKPPFSVKIKGHVAIVHYADSILFTEHGIKAGDTVNEINNTSVAQLIDSLREYTPCCYENGITNVLSKLIIRGHKDSIMVFKINNRVVSLKNTYYFNQQIKSPRKSFKINDSVAYVNFYEIGNDKAFKKVVKDMGYPRYYVFDYTSGSKSDLSYLPQHFLRKSNPFMIRYSPDFRRLGTFKSSTQNTRLFLPFFHKKIPFSKIVILINSSVQSHKEFITMALQTNEHIYTVGDTSAAALAEVRALYLPGNIEFVFTANAAYYPNEITTHRSSIKLNYYVDEFENEDVMLKVAEIFIKHAETDFKR